MIARCTSDRWMVEGVPEARFPERERFMVRRECLFRTVVPGTCNDRIELAGPGE